MHIFTEEICIFNSVLVSRFWTIVVPDTPCLCRGKISVSVLQIIGFNLDEITFQSGVTLNIDSSWVKKIRYKYGLLMPKLPIKMHMAGVNHVSNHQLVLIIQCMLSTAWPILVCNYLSWFGLCISVDMCTLLLAWTSCPNTRRHVYMAEISRRIALRNKEKILNMRPRIKLILKRVQKLNTKTKLWIQKSNRSKPGQRFEYLEKDHHERTAPAVPKQKTNFLAFWTIKNGITYMVREDMNIKIRVWNGLLFHL